ncbi:hypothetical protein CAPN009_21050 [Capnocytophaga canimorsus]|nr:hypothetical protein CAPN009_21050 [Capnocytophaga canimorsus]
MAVTKKPNRAANHCDPEVKPIYGGRIRFPAPKNIANRAKPIVVVLMILRFGKFINAKGYKISLSKIIKKMKIKSKAK